MLEANTCAEQSSNDDSPMYTVRYVVRASTLLPLSGLLSQRAIAVLNENKKCCLSVCEFWGLRIL
jgi:hypothetical protein